MFGALLATSVLLNVHLLFSRKSCVATRSAAVELVGSTSVVLPACCSDVAKLRWKLNLLKARPNAGMTYPLENGLAAQCVPLTVLNAMGMSPGRQKDKLPHVPPDPPLGAEHSPGQVGQFVFDHMVVGADRRPQWTAKIWDHLVSNLAHGADGGPPGYANSGSDIKAAIAWVLDEAAAAAPASTPHKDYALAVFSAISPWVEAILHHSFAVQRALPSSITSLDFNPCRLDGIARTSIEKCAHVHSLRDAGGPSFDLAVSYSGFEHDGLGRYGDPINAEGDISAMREMWLHVRAGGRLLLAVPLADIALQPKTEIVVWSNGKLKVLTQRSYGAERLLRMYSGWVIEGWGVQGRFTPAPSEADVDPLSAIAAMIKDCQFLLKSGWPAPAGHTQPVVVLRKRGGVTFGEVLKATKSVHPNVATRWRDFEANMNITRATSRAGF